MCKNTSGINKPRRIDIFDENDNFLISFASLRSCSRNMQIPPTTLYKAIKHKSSIKNKYYRYGN